MLDQIRADFAIIRERDPAARGPLEILLCYPGFQAISLHRLSHRLWRSRLPLKLPARLLSQLGRGITGIEIHPGATIGRRLFIDHGMGIVIGATAEIGDDVLMYHGVTLGGTSLGHGKRHPTLGDDIVVGAGATVLGAVTIGSHSVIGANAVVVADAPEHSLLVGAPAVARPRCAASDERYSDPAIYVI